MREQLLPYLNQKAYVFGWISHWERFNNGTIGIMLERPTVVGWKNDWEIRLDHMWAYGSEQRFDELRKEQGITRHDRMQYAGTVAQYSRGDGSMDYAVKTRKDVLSAIRLVEFLNERRMKLEDWQYVKEVIDQDRIYRVATDAPLEMQEQFIATVLRDAEANIRVLEASAERERQLEEKRKANAHAIAYENSRARSSRLSQPWKPKGFANA